MVWVLHPHCKKLFLVSSLNLLSLQFQILMIQSYLSRGKEDKCNAQNLILGKRITEFVSHRAMAELGNH